jgi:hypothetical protein
LDESPVSVIFLKIKIGVNNKLESIYFVNLNFDILSISTAGELHERHTGFQALEQ